MDKALQKRRARRIRARVHGTAARPRASVYRSLRSMSLQFIDDAAGKTLLGVSAPAKAGQSKMEQATALGMTAAKQAQAAGITTIVFDRAGYAYHGRVRAVAEAMRTGGLTF